MKRGRWSREEMSDLKVNHRPAWGVAVGLAKQRLGPHFGPGSFVGRPWVPDSSGPGGVRHGRGHEVAGPGAARGGGMARIADGAGGIVRVSSELRQGGGRPKRPPTRFRPSRSGLRSAPVSTLAEERSMARSGFLWYCWRAGGGPERLGGFGSTTRRAGPFSTRRRDARNGLGRRRGAQRSCGSVASNGDTGADH